MYRIPPIQVPLKTSFAVFLCSLFHNSSVDPQEKTFLSAKQVAYMNIINEHKQRLFYDPALHAQVRSLLENET